MTFHSVGNGIIPTDERIYFSEGLFYHQPGNFQLDTEIQVSPVLGELCFFLLNKMLNLSCSWMKFSQELHVFAGNMLESLEFTSGWWFQTFLFSISFAGNVIIPTDTHIFQMDCFTRIQPCSSRNQQSNFNNSEPKSSILAKLSLEDHPPKKAAVPKCSKEHPILDCIFLAHVPKKKPTAP